MSIFPPLINSSGDLCTIFDILCNYKCLIKEIIEVKITIQFTPFTLLFILHLQMHARDVNDNHNGRYCGEISAKTSHSANLGSTRPHCIHVKKAYVARKRKNLWYNQSILCANKSAVSHFSQKLWRISVDRGEKSARNSFVLVF